MPDQKPSPLPEVEVSEGSFDPIELELTDSAEYQSSEQIQRSHNISVFAAQQKKKQKVALTAKQKVLKALDEEIAKHSSTKDVRAFAKRHKRTNEYQLDLSADLVELLEKIKKDLR